MCIGVKFLKTILFRSMLLKSIGREGIYDSSWFSRSCTSPPPSFCWSACMWMWDTTTSLTVSTTNPYTTQGWVVSHPHCLRSREWGCLATAALWVCCPCTALPSACLDLWWPRQKPVGHKGMQVKWNYDGVSHAYQHKCHICCPHTTTIPPSLTTRAREQALSGLFMIS